MKTIHSFYKLVLTLLILGSSTHLAAQIKLGDNGATMSPYALLELESSDKGLLLPRMTSEERDAAFNQETPAGMMIFNTDENVMQYFFVETDPTARAVGEKTWKTLEDIGVPIGTDFPETPDIGSLFYETETETLNLWNGTEWIDFISLNRAPVAAPQTLAIDGTTLTISDGNSISLPTTNPVAATPQTLALVGTTLTISNGNSVSLPLTSSVTPTSGTDSQTLTVSGTTLTISNGNSVTLPLTSSVTPTSGTDSQTLVYGSGSATQTTIEIADGNALNLQATGTLSFTQVGTDTLLITGAAASTGTDSQTLVYGSGSATQTTIEIADGNALNLQATGTLSFTQVGTDTLLITGAAASTGTDSQTLVYGSGSATQTTIEIADGNALNLQATGTLSFTQVGTDTLLITGTDETGTDSQTLVYGSGSATQTTIEIADGNALNLQATGTLSFTQVGTDTLLITGTDETGTDSQTLVYGSGSATQTTIEIADGNALNLQATGTLSFTQVGTDTLLITGTDETGTDSQTLVYGSGSATQTTIEIADGNALNLQATGTLSFTQVGTDTLLITGAAASTGTDSQTLVYGSGSATQTTIEIADGNALNLQATGTLSFTQVGTDTLLITGAAPASLTGTTTNSSLRYDGTNFVENTQLLSNGTDQTTIKTNLSITGTNTTIDADVITLTGATTLATTTLGASVYDAEGGRGSAGQLLSATVTGTQWITTGVLPATSGANTNTTAVWNGTAWVNNATIQSDGSTQATITTDLRVTEETSLATTTIANNLTVQGASVLATTTLGASVYDAEGGRGSAGQLLSATVTGTQWITTGVLPATSGANTNTTAVWNGTAWVNNATIQSDGSTQATITTDLTVTEETSLATTTIADNLTVQGASVLATTTLGASVYDAEGARGSAGQLLSATVTGTQWITTGVLPATSGANTNTTAVWNGTAWVNNATIKSDGSTQATITTDLTVTEETSLATATIDNELRVSGASSLATTTIADQLTVQGNSALATATIANNLTVSGASALATTTLSKGLLDATGAVGTAGQLLSTTGTSTQWVDSPALSSGTTTNTTLRWDGSAWVEATNFLNSGSSTATLATNVTVTGTLAVSEATSLATTTIADQLTVQGDSALATTTISDGLTVQGTSALATATIANNLTVSGASALATTTLSKGLLDATGSVGTAGQLLSTTGTSTQWVDSPALSSGTTTNTTLRWDGSAWVEATNFLNSGSTTATLATNVTVSGTLAVSEATSLATTTIADQLTVQGDSALATTTISDNLTVQGTSALATATIANNLTVSGASALATTTLSKGLLDATGSVGTAGQLLSTTGTSTQWVDSPALSSGTTTNTTLRWDGSAWVEAPNFLNSGSTTATLATNVTVTGTLAVSEATSLATTTISDKLTVQGDSALATTTISDNLTVQGTSALATATIANNLTVSGASTLATTTIQKDLTVAGASSLATTTIANNLTVQGATVLATTTLGASVYDAEGARGTAGQLLSATVTGTQWLTAGVLPVTTGANTNTTAYWNGTAWVTNPTLLSDGSTQATITTDLSVAGESSLATATLTGDLTVQGTSALATATIANNLTVSGASALATTTISDNLTVQGTSALATATIANNLTVSGASTLATTTIQKDLTVAGASSLATTTIQKTLTVLSTSTLATTTIQNNLTVQGTSTLATTTLTAGLVDATGALGSAGQLLSSTGTSTRWVASGGGHTIEAVTGSGTPNVATTLLLVTPAGSDITIALPAVSSYSNGFELTIKRVGVGATGTNDNITIDPDGSETIDGAATVNLNTGYQRITIVKYGTGWIQIN